MTPDGKINTIFRGGLSIFGGYLIIVKYLLLGVGSIVYLIPRNYLKDTKP